MQARIASMDTVTNPPWDCQLVCRSDRFYPTVKNEKKGLWLRSRAGFVTHVSMAMSGREGRSLPGDPSGMNGCERAAGERSENLRKYFRALIF